MRRPLTLLLDVLQGATCTSPTIRSHVKVNMTCGCLCVCVCVVHLHTRTQTSHAHTHSYGCGSRRHDDDHAIGEPHPAPGLMTNTRQSRAGYMMGQWSVGVCTCIRWGRQARSKRCLACFDGEPCERLDLRMARRREPTEERKKDQESVSDLVRQIQRPQQVQRQKWAREHVVKILVIHNVALFPNQAVQLSARHARWAVPCPTSHQYLDGIAGNV